MKQVSTFKCTKPCGSCPYRTDAPLQLWSKIEYEKLMESEDDLIGKVYGCHRANGSVCVGWLMDQDRRGLPSIALRLALSRENVTRRYLDSLRSPVPLYESVADMVRANYPDLLGEPERVLSPEEEALWFMLDMTKL